MRVRNGVISVKDRTVSAQGKKSARNHPCKQMILQGRGVFNQA